MVVNSLKKKKKNMENCASWKWTESKPLDSCGTPQLSFWINCLLFKWNYQNELSQGKIWQRCLLFIYLTALFQLVTI